MKSRNVGAVMTMAVVMILLGGVSLAQTWKDVDIKNPDGSYVYSPDTRAAMKAVDASRVMLRCSEIISSNPGGDAYFCPGEFVFREDMAVYLLRARRGANYIPATPPLPPMPPQVQDTLAYYSMAPWIYELVSEGISNPSTCGVNSFCPSRPITRAEAIELMVKTYNARQCQASKVPPDVTQNTKHYSFSDVQMSDQEAKWINAACSPDVGILTTECSSTGNFHKNWSLTRADAAVWISRIFTGSVAEACQLLKVTKTGSDGTGRVTSNPSGVDCGSFCDVNFAKNTVVTLTATADSGSKFTGWSGANCTGTNNCTVTMDAAKTVNATFVQAITYALTVAKSGTGAGTVTTSPSGINCGATCSANFAKDQVVNVNAVAATGSVFSGWSGACTGSGACAVTMDGAKSIMATFSLTSVSLQVNLSGTGVGTVTSTPAGISCGTDCNEAYLIGTVVTLNAAASSGSNFIGWSGSGTEGCTTNQCQVAMNQARSVSAVFDTSNSGYKLTVIKGGNGSGTVSSSPAGINCGSACTYNFQPNTQVTLSVSLAQGTASLNWSAPCSGTGSCTVTMNSDVTVTADFTAEENKLSISGYITYKGNTLSGITVQVGDTLFTQCAPTSGDGRYVCTSLSMGVWTIVPDLSYLYDFDPTQKSVTLDTNSSKSGVNFTATRKTPVIRNFRPDPAGIDIGQSTTLRWDNPYADRLVLTPGNIVVTGQTSVIVNPRVTTTYTLTATNEPGTSNPKIGTETTTVTVNGYTISGRILRGGIGLEGVKVSGCNREAVTDVNGDYQILGLDNGTCTVVPSLPSYTFNPDSLLVNINNGHRTGIDFTAEGSGLVGWWKFDERYEIETTADSSYFQNHAIRIDATRGQGGKVGWALGFDGINDEVFVFGKENGDGIDRLELCPTGGMTVSAWVKINALPQASAWTRVVGKGSDNGSRNYGLWYNGSGQALFQISSADGQTANCITATGVYDFTPLQPGSSWYLITGVKRGGTMSLYINGFLRATQTIEFTPVAVAEDDLSFGYAGWNAHLNGLIDDVRLYNRPLTNSEIDDLVSIPTWSGASLTASNVSTNSLTLTWSSAIDPQGIAGYRVFQNNLHVATVGNVNSTTITGLVQDTSYLFKVEAFDAMGNYTIDGPSFTTSTLQLDTTTPTWPTGSLLTVVERRSDRVRLSWPTATDNVAVTRYRIESTGAAPLDVNSPTTTTWLLGLSADASYTFTVKAGDAQGNWSAPLSTTGSTLPGGLVGHWKFDEASGSVAIDDSGFGNNGTMLNGPTRTTGKLNGALQFDGVDDNVNVPDTQTTSTLQLTGDITISAWVNIETLPNQWVRVVGKGNDTARNYGLWYRKHNDQTLHQDVLFQIYDGVTYANVGTDDVTPRPDSLPTPQWQLITGVKQGNKISIYLNATLVAETSIFIVPPTTTDPLTIGSSGLTGAKYHKGFIDDVRLYSRALSLAEVQALYATETAMRLTVQSNGNAVNGYAYRVFDSGKSYVVQTGDVLEFDVYLDPNNPQFLGGFDAQFSPTEPLRGFAQIIDQNSARIAPWWGIMGFAKGRWYHRTFSIGSYVGRTLSNFMIAHEGETAGTYVIWLDNVKVTNTGVVKSIIYDDGPLASNTPAFASTPDVTNEILDVAVRPDNVNNWISGRVMMGGSGLAGVTVSAGTKTALTDANGDYTIKELVNGGYPVTPSKFGYVFTPTGRTVTIASGDVTNQNFTAEPVVLSVVKSGNDTTAGTVTSSPAPIDCGSVCSATFDYNQVVTLYARPAPGATFNGWSVSGFPGVCTGTGECQVQITQATTVTANFTSTLVGHWKFDEVSGTTALDSSGLGNNGAFGGAPARVAGKLSGALSFDGVDDYVSVPDNPSLQLPGDMTISVWFKSDARTPAGTPSWTRLIGKGYQSAMGIYYNQTDGNFYFWLIEQNSYSAAAGTIYGNVGNAAPIPVGKWTLLTGIRRGNSIYMYADGALVSSAQITNPSPNTAGFPLTIGLMPCNGVIDDARVYNYGLNGKEIRRLYSESTHGLVGYWRIDEGSGTSAVDNSGLGNTGTLINGPEWVAGKLGKALRFSGEGQYVLVNSNPATLIIKEDLTLSAWVKAESRPTGWVRAVGKGNVQGVGLWVHGPTGQILFQIYDGTTYYNAGTVWGTVVNPITMQIGQWYLLTGIRKGGNIYLYANGALVASTPIGVESPTNTDPLTIGGPGLAFGGIIDDVRIYDRALSDIEIKHLGDQSTNFTSVVPCRVFDTRETTVLSAGERRVFSIAGACGVPQDAVALASNVTVVNGGAEGWLTVLAGNQTSSPTKTMPIPLGVAQGKAAIVQLATDGSGTISITNDSLGTVHVILDVRGYFK